MTLFWLSFAKPGAFLGVCFVEATSRPLALARAIELGIRPEGDALVSPFKPAWPGYEVARRNQNRLITDPAELERLIPDVAKVGAYEDAHGVTFSPPKIDHFPEGKPS